MWQTGICTATRLHHVALVAGVVAALEQDKPNIIKSQMMSILKAIFHEALSLICAGPTLMNSTCNTNYSTYILYGSLKLGAFWVMFNDSANIFCGVEKAV